MTVTEKTASAIVLFMPVLFILIGAINNQNYHGKMQKAFKKHVNQLREQAKEL